MKASDLQRAQAFVYDISLLEDRLAHLTTTYLNPAPVGKQHKTRIMLDGGSGVGRSDFFFLMTEPVYLALKEQTEKEIDKLKTELKEMGVEYGD